MKRTFNPIMEVIRFTAEDVIVTSGVGTTSTADPVKFIFEAGTPYFARGEEINQSYNSNKVKPGFYYYFTPSADTDTFLYNKTDAKMSAQNDMYLKSGYIYAWYKLSGWYSDNLTIDSYPIDPLTGKYDFPTN